MQSSFPKQFMELSGKPILMHSIELFAETIPGIEIIVVLPEDQMSRWEKLCNKYEFNVTHTIVAGGSSRFASVKNGLAAIKIEGVVAVHDAVRPLVSKKTINNAFRTAEMYGNAVPAIPINDSIRQVNSTLSVAVDRSNFCIIQTPQCFKNSLLKEAYEQEYKFNFTDDATVLESTGQKIYLIDGNAENIKITRPLDLIIAEALLKQPV